MNNESIEKNAGQLGHQLEEATATVRKSANEALDTVREETNNAVSCASDYVRKNPLSSVLGAVAFGVAVGCLIAISGRPTPSLKDRYLKEPLDQASDVLTKVSENLGTLASNLKFW